MSPVPTPRSGARLDDDTIPDAPGKAPPLVIPVLSSPAPAPKTPSLSVPRKLVDMLSPLIRGSKRASPAPASPPAGPGPAQGSNPPSSLHTPMTPTQSSKCITIPPPIQIPSAKSDPHQAANEPYTLKYSNHLSDIGSPSRSVFDTKHTLGALLGACAGADSHNVGFGAKSVAEPKRTGAVTPSPFASEICQLDPGTPPPILKITVPSRCTRPQPQGAAMAVFPALGRLCNAARYCALPPSRTSPEPGTANYPTELLAMSLALPPRMARQNWCLDDYCITEKLYKGYASTVYKAVCKSSSDVVVLKVYTLAAVCDLYKFQIYREVRLHSRLQHENIIAMHAAFQEGDKVVMVQEYADGADLFSVTQKYDGRLTERLAVQLVLEPFVRVVNYLHTQGILHRDIKPENILFTKSMCLKLGDFGLAIDVEEEQPVTRAGTLDYMAPEVLRCPYKSAPDENKSHAHLHYSAGVDAWAVGVMTYELLVGYPPFYNQTRSKTEQQIVSCMPSFPRSMSDEARDFISSALSKDPLQRLTLTQMLHHPWIEGWRSRRSLRQPLPTSPPLVRVASAAAAPPALGLLSASPIAAAAAVSMPQPAAYPRVQLGQLQAGRQMAQGVPQALPGTLRLQQSVPRPEVAVLPSACLSKALSINTAVDGSVIVGAREWQSPCSKEQAAQYSLSAWLHNTAQ